MRGCLWPPRMGAGWLTKVSAFAGLLIMAATLVEAQQPLRSPIPPEPVPVSSGWHDVSLPDYRKHLEALRAVVETCAKARDAKACDPALVGQDDRVSLGEGTNVERRPVRYDWLRLLLQEARKKDAPTATKIIAGAKIAQSSAVLPPPPTTTELLQSAEKRLAADERQTGDTAHPEPENALQRKAMEQVLAAREFRGLGQTSPEESLKEKVGNWLNSLFARAAEMGAKAPWLGRGAVASFILAICGGLAWGLVQFERRRRIRLTKENLVPMRDAPSARDWQLWLEDARNAAGTGLWREAIHCVYWGTISHLESRRLWPADRARTPREYVALVEGEDPRRAGLAALTGSFERTWYGGRPTDEGEYRHAEELAQGLIASPVLFKRGTGR